MFPLVSEVFAVIPPCFIFYNAMKIISLLLIIVMCCLQTNLAQQVQFPAASSRLNYTVIMFEYPQIPKAKQYHVQIAYASDVRFTHPVRETRSHSLATLIDSGLYFGKQYRWRYAGETAKGKLLGWSPATEFEIMSSPLISPDSIRFRVSTYDTAQTQKGYIFSDVGVIIDRSGNPVWFMPGYTKDNQLRDLTLTPQGTVTCLDSWSMPRGIPGTLVHLCHAFETNLLGKTLWKAPNDGRISHDTVEYYTSEMTRLSNGNYLITGGRFIPVKAPSDTTKTVRIFYNTIIEYDKAGNVLWNWQAQNYFDARDVFAEWDGKALMMMPTHMNSVDIDEKNNCLYVSFRNVSRVIKIDRKSGNVLWSMGAKMSSGEATYGDGLFNYQHTPRLLPNGHLLMYNNNTGAAPDKISSVLELSLPDSAGNPPRKVWEFPCNFGSIAESFSAGQGAVELLPNGNILAGMGAVNRIFEVQRDKHIVWECFSEQYSPQSSWWAPITKYRISFVRSLYPTYFTVQFFGDDVPKPYLRLANDGSMDDNYEVRLIQKTEDIPQANSLTVAVKAGEIRDIPLGDIQDSAIQGKIVSCSITSRRNPDIVRIVQLKHGVVKK